MTETPSRPLDERIGVLGLGAMGRAIAKRLINLGLTVWGRDIEPTAEERAAQIGVVVADAGQMELVDVLITSLPDDSTVTSALIGRNGLARNLRRGAMILEVSTILPETMRTVYEIGANRGVTAIDCALSGGPDDAENGTLLLLVGANDLELARATPLLERLGTVAHAGEVGAGKTIKLVNNVMTMGNVLVAAEAFNLGLRAGLPRKRLFDILSISGGRSHQFLKRFPHVLNGDFAARFRMSLGDKDLKLALSLAEQIGATMGATALMSQLYSVACGSGLSDEDIVAIEKFYESLDRQTERGAPE